MEGENELEHGESKTTEKVRRIDRGRGRGRGKVRATKRKQSVREEREREKRERKRQGEDRYCDRKGVSNGGSG